MEHYKEQVPENMESEQPIPVPHAGEWALIKRELFLGDTSELMPEQPHGIDLMVQNIVEVNPKTGEMTVIEWHTEQKENGEQVKIYKLNSGRTYIVMMMPFLRRPFDEVAQHDFIHLFPRSSLHRMGIGANQVPFYGTNNAIIQEKLAEIFDTYYDGMREGAMPIYIAHPSGVEVESGAPFVQAVIERSRGVSSDAIDAWRERMRSQGAQLHLSEVKEFKAGIVPRLTKEPAKIDIAETLSSENDVYQLKAGQAYIFETQEFLSFSADEIGIAEGSSKSGAMDIYGDALIDAGFKGKVTFLAIPQKDLIVRSGDAIGTVFRVKVPSTPMPYQGSYQEESTR